jgi:copper amine oxidase-like protein
MKFWFSLPYTVSPAIVPRIAAVLLCGLLFYGFGAADAASTPAQAQLAAAPADFGSPPSGQIPILYNDHTVYAKPDVLRRARVLAAILKDGHMYVPLRSMFEQMGATVSASADGKTVTASKPGASVSVTLNKSEVVINGETRPLDVPPIMYQGVLLVPVRVISEGMGAYVLWVPDRHLVVVRYITPTPPPTAAPTMAPTPTPTPAERTYQGFIQGAWAATRNYNEFSAGGYCPEDYLLAAAYAFKNSPFAVKVDFRQYAYVTSKNLTDILGNQFTQFATIDGGTAFTPVFLARQNTLDARLEYKVADPRIYVGLGYIQTANNYGYPRLNGAGVGVEKLPDLRKGINVFGSAFYYPTASGNYTVTNPASPNFGTTYRQQYQIMKYDVGLALILARSPIYLYGGFSADHYRAKQNAPIGQTHDGPYIGLGVRF